MTDKETHPALALQAPAPLATTDNSVDILHTIAAAIQQGPPADELEKYLAVAERLEAKRAEAAFNAAFAAFTADCPDVPRNHQRKDIQQVTADGRSGAYRYANIDDVLGHVRPYLIKHGLAIRFGDATVEDGNVRQSAIVMHRDGHSVSASFACPPDERNKAANKQQLFGGAETYAKRRALAAVLGLNLGDPPVENEAPPEPITPKQVAELVTMLDSDAIRDRAKSIREAMLKTAGLDPETDGLEQIPAESYDEIHRRLQAAIDKAANG